MVKHGNVPCVVDC